MTMLFRHTKTTNARDVEPGTYTASSYGNEWVELWPKERGDEFLRAHLGENVANKIIADDIGGFVYTGVQERV